MGKYEPLAEALRRRSAEGQDQWAASFDEIEEVLGFPLPRSARTYREWWSNQRGGGHSQARGWQEAGWQVWKVDLPAEEAVFRRRRGDAHRRPDAPEEALFEQASAYLGTADRAVVLREALKALCEREAARRLARLGGSIPDLQAPPRRRFG